MATRGDGVQFQRAKMEPSTGRNPVEKKVKNPKIRCLFWIIMEKGAGEMTFSDIIVIRVF